MDDGKQYRRQSKDFGETWNIQTDMNVSEYRYQEIFHNWEHPSECKQSRPGSPCWVCSALKETGIAKNYSVKILIVKNLHLDEIKELLKTNNFKAIIYIGNLEIDNNVERLPIPLYCSNKTDLSEKNIINQNENLKIDNFYINKTQNSEVLGNFLQDETSYIIVNSLTNKIIN